MEEYKSSCTVLPCFACTIALKFGYLYSAISPVLDIAIEKRVAVFEYSNFIEIED